MAISVLKAIVVAIFSSNKTICTQFGRKKIIHILLGKRQVNLPHEKTIAFSAEKFFEVIFKQQRYKINLNERVCC